MKKTLSLLIIAIIALTSSINANAWTDRNTFNLKGPVKSVIGNNNCDEYLEFEENGDIIFEEDPDIYWAFIERDNKGRITHYPSEEYTYNNKGQVIKTLVVGGGQEIVTKRYYNAKGQVIKEVSSGDGPMGRITTTTTYTYQKFDKYGNWTKRTAKNKYGKEVQTRTITYYE